MKTFLWRFFNSITTFLISFLWTHLFAKILFFVWVWTLHCIKLDFVRLLLQAVLRLYKVLRYIRNEGNILLLFSSTWNFDGDSKSDIVLSLKWLSGPQKSNFPISLFMVWFEYYFSLTWKFNGDSKSDIVLYI